MGRDRNAYHGKVSKEQKYEVTPIELFFDLIYAFAVSQLTQFLFTDQSWKGIVETLIMLIAIYMVWAYTSWAATMIRADRSKTRRMILTIMFIGLFMNTSMGRAFYGLGWLFVFTFLIIQLGRTCWTIINSPDALFRDHFWRVLIWLAFSTPFWITGAFANGKFRILLWLTASIIDLTGTWVAHPIPSRRLLSEDVEFDAPHLLERCRLFRLIAIGEMVFTSGAAISTVHMNLITVSLGIATMAEIVSLWALTFGRFFRQVAGHVEETRDPIRTSRYAINALVVILFGLVMISVANKQIITHPLEMLSPIIIFLLIGGPICFLAAQSWYLIVVPKIIPRSYVICVLFLLAAGSISYLFPAWISFILVALILSILALFDSR